MAESPDLTADTTAAQTVETGTDYVQLIDRACQGDRAASDLLADDLYPKIWGIAHSYATEETLVEDLVQEAMLTIYGRLSRYKPTYLFLPWAIRVAEGRFRDLLRQKRLAARKSHERSPSEESGTEFEHQAVDERLGPEETLLKDEEARQVRAALAQLPKLLRQIVALHWFGGVSYETIARDFDMDRNRVYHLSYVARQRLAKILLTTEGRPS